MVDMVLDLVVALAVVVLGPANTTKTLKRTILKTIFVQEAAMK
jgi:hypothetical protein